MLVNSLILFNDAKSHDKLLFVHNMNRYMTDLKMFYEYLSIQKLLLAGGSALIALSNPWRADMVAVNGEVTGTQALRSGSRSTFLIVKGQEVHLV